MTILDLVPVRWFSADINVLQEGVLLAELRFLSWRENGSIRFSGSIYSIRKDGMFSNHFLLEENGHGLCYATMKSFWRRTVVWIMKASTISSNQWAGAAESIFSAKGWR
jgi:hypothetical protein